jgi:hypothetical protein
MLGIEDSFFRLATVMIVFRGTTFIFGTTLFLIFPSNGSNRNGGRFLLLINIDTLHGGLIL